MDAVIFDVDGVLTDSEPLHLEAVNRVLAPLGVNLSEEENKKFLGLDDGQFWERLSSMFDLNEDIPTLAAQRIDEVIKLIREGIVTLPGVPEFITGCVMRGLSLAVASSSPQKVVHATLDELGLAKTFKVALSGDDVKKAKPDPAIFLKAASSLGVPPKRCMVIEDSPNGILAARRADMFTVAVYNSYNFDLDLSVADSIFSGLNHFNWAIFEGR